MQHNNISNCKFNLQHGLLLALQLSHCVIAWICFCNFEKDLSREEKKAKGVRNWPIGAWPTPETFLLNEGLVGANPSWRHYIQQIPTGNMVHCHYWDVLLRKQLDSCPCLNARTPAAKQWWARLPLGRTLTHGTWVLWAGKETSVPSGAQPKRDIRASACLSRAWQSASPWKSEYMHLMHGSTSMAPTNTRHAGKGLCNS